MFGFFVAITIGSGNNGAFSVIGKVGFLGLIALPISIGIGILRYRLYEIDRLISRTLSYALLTGLLVGVFVGLVLLTTRVLPFSSPVGVAASTLAAAGALRPAAFAGCSGSSTAASTAPATTPRLPSPPSAPGCATPSTPRPCSASSPPRPAAPSSPRTSRSGSSRETPRISPRHARDRRRCSLALVAARTSRCRARSRPGTRPEGNRDPHAPVLRCRPARRAAPAAATRSAGSSSRSRSPCSSSIDAANYAVLVFRVHHALPLGRLAVFLAPAWVPVLVLAPLPIVLFPDGKIPPGRWRWTFWAYIALARRFLAGIGRENFGAFTERRVVIDKSGSLSALTRARARSRSRPQHGGDRAYGPASPRWSRTRSSTSAARPETIASS